MMKTMTLGTEFFLREKTRTSQVGSLSSQVDTVLFGCCWSIQICLKGCLWKLNHQREQRASYPSITSQLQFPLCAYSEKRSEPFNYFSFARSKTLKQHALSTALEVCVASLTQTLTWDPPAPSHQQLPPALSLRKIHRKVPRRHTDSFPWASYIVVLGKVPVCRY